MPNPSIAGWYSPNSGRFWTGDDAQLVVNAGSSLPEDSIPLTYAYETRQLLKLLETFKKENQDLICAVESAREELKKLEDDLK